MLVLGKWESDESWIHLVLNDGDALVFTGFVRVSDAQDSSSNEISLALSTANWFRLSLSERCTFDFTRPGDAAPALLAVDSESKYESALSIRFPSGVTMHLLKIKDELLPKTLFDSAQQH